MHVLYHLPTEYNNLNDGYLKDLDDTKEIKLEDLHADLQCKYDRLIDLGRIEKHDDDDADKIVKEENALKKVYKKQFKGKCHVCGKIGHKGADCWTLEENKETRPSIIMEEKMLRQKIIALQAIATTATRKDIEKQNVIYKKSML